MFDITDMGDMTDASQFNYPSHSRDVAEWHQKEQVAYWKSRAISLKLENDMLHQQIKNMYTKQIREYEEYIKSQQQGQIEMNNQEVVEDVRITEHNDEESQENEDKLPPKEQVGAKKLREMTELYGDKASKMEWKLLYNLIMNVK